METIYLDHNATTPVLPEVVDVVAREMRDGFANPGSRHSYGRRARKVLEESRESLASILGAQPDEVIFTSGGTEATNLAILGLTVGTPGEILTTAGEHPATTETCATLAGWTSRNIPVDGQGNYAAAFFDEMDWRSVRFATVILAHNETGVIQDTSRVAEKCEEYGIPLHLDAVQAVGKIPVDFADSRATTLALGAHKFHGPRGVGALLVRRGVRLTPQLFGGHQEEGLRPGTEPVPLIAGMVKALEIWNADRESTADRLAKLRDHLEFRLRELCPPIVVNGEQANRLPNTANVSFPGCDGEALLVNLDLEGIACSLGSTCASGSAEPAPALVAMGLDAETIRSAVRFSLGRDNTPQEIETSAKRIARVVSKLR